jgi:hypothetical protein
MCLGVVSLAAVVLKRAALYLFDFTAAGLGDAVNLGSEF